MKKLVVGILAHVDSGKTTLSEAMLYTAGKIRKLGRVDHKDAYLDTDAQERERGITIFSKQAVFTYDGMEITLLDTPGHVDFSAEMERTLQVLDYAILVINGMDGVQSHTDTLWKLLKRYEIPTFIFVNKMDMEGTDKDAVFQNIRKKLDGDCVDFSSGDRDEQIAMADERLLDTYLDSGMVETEDIIEAILDRKIFPCFWGSALKLSGVQELLDAMNTYMVMPAYNAEFGGRIFKISRDAKGERLTYMKVTGGSLKCREQIEGTEGKVNQIRIYSGARYETVEEASAGTICAVTGLGETSAGQGVGCEQENVFAGLEPVLSYKVSYPEDKDAVVVLHFYIMSFIDIIYFSFLLYFFIFLSIQEASLSLFLLFLDTPPVLLPSSLQIQSNAPYLYPGSLYGRYFPPVLQGYESPFFLHVSLHPVQMPYME